MKLLGMNTNKSKITIEEIINVETDMYISSVDFFKQNENVVWNYRTECQKAIKKQRGPLLLCSTCQQMVQIKGGGGNRKKTMYFSHLNDSDDCPIKTDSKYLKQEILKWKFNGQKEGEKHIEAKNMLAKFLNLTLEIKNVEIEKVNKGKKDLSRWRKPDITTVFKKNDLVFEVQLSTTFLDVICERQNFYKENETYILWVFKEFSIEKDKQRFTDKDIFYSNNRNAFVFDDRAIESSLIEGELILRCFYQKPYILNQKIEYQWENHFVTLRELTFSKFYKLFYFDVDAEEKKLGEEIYINSLNIVEDEVEPVLSDDKYDIMVQNQQEKLFDNYIFQSENEEFYKKLNNKFRHLEIYKVFIDGVNSLGERIEDLFRDGYQLINKEKTFLSQEFKLQLKTTQFHPKHSMLFFISKVLFLSKLNKEQIQLYKKYEDLLFALLSIKFEIIIGSGFRNINQTVNLYLNPKNENRYQYSEIIIHAIKKFIGLEKYVRVYDKKNKFKNKLAEASKKSFKIYDAKRMANDVFSEFDIKYKA